MGEQTMLAVVEIPGFSSFTGDEMDDLAGSLEHMADRLRRREYQPHPDREGFKIAICGKKGAS